MKKHIKKKLLRAAVAMLCCLATVTSLNSCNEDFVPWDIVTLEVGNSQESSISHNGATFTIDVNSNTKWSVKAPEWITVDKTSGEGKNTINVTVPENKKNYRRTGTIEITAGSDNAEYNVAGHKTLNITVTQDPAIIIKITAAKVERIQDGTYIITDNIITHKPEKYFYHRYKATIEYEIDTNLTEEEIAEIMKTPYMYITLNQKWSFYVPGGNYTFYDYIKIEDLPMTRGTHTVTGETEENKWGNHVESITVEIRRIDTYGDMQIVVNNDFDVNDSRD